MKSEQVRHWSEEKRLADYIKHHFGLSIQEAKPIRGILKLISPSGDYVLKRTHSKEKERWRMIVELAAHVGIRFPIPAPIPTQTGQLIFDGFQHSYVLLPWFKGKNVQLRRSEDWVRITQQLAFFHQVSQSFQPTHAYRKLHKLGKWQADWKHAYRQLELFHLAAKWTDQPTQTDQSWLKVAHYSLGMMENLLKYFEKMKGDQCCIESAKKGNVCHGNLHPHNMLMDDQDQFFLIDWNQAVLDVRTRDLAQWMLYAYYQTRSPELLIYLLQAYQQVSPLMEEEYALIYVRFLYPERLIRVLRSIYEDQTLPITAGAPSVIFASKVEEQKLELMKKYPELIQSAFGVNIPVIDWISQHSSR